MIRSPNLKHNVKYSLLRLFRKIAESDYQPRHVRPSVCMEQLGSNWTNFHDIWVFFENVSRDFNGH